MANDLKLEPLAKAAFAQFGDVIEKDGAEQLAINEGRCIRFHDLAKVDIVGDQPRTLINLFAPQAAFRPLSIRLVERHPLGSQAFIPMSADPFVVLVCEDENGTPVRPRAFVTNGKQGVNYRANVWHAPLIALAAETTFAVVDRGGEGVNLEEHIFSSPLCVAIPE
ncbi:MAG: ureidoglycolate lyase [Beijerinckiaceae bacterium]|jgi:ureidoglycolate lyase|nr:ureidoglycolate lyase [Beijerinckiaceae bacterium]